MTQSENEKRRVTLSDVARKAGVSKSTASLVLNQSELIKAETRDKVLAAIEALGYVYNRSAASLRLRHSKAVGVVIDDLTNPFFAEFTKGLETTLAEHGFITMMANTSQERERQQKVLDTLLEHHVAGLVLFPVPGTKEEDLIRYIKSRTPLLIAMRPMNWNQISVDYVGVDNKAGVMEATEYLISNGHSRIAFIGGISSQARFIGYLEAMRLHGIKPWVSDEELYRCEPTRANGYKMMLNIMQSENPPTAVLFYNDLMAFGAMSALGELNLRAGQDISIIGHDGVTAGAFSNPPLTTIGMEPLSLGEQAAKQILQRIEHPDTPVSHYVFRPTLHIRASAGKIG
ncbi:LacI family DNA-binding transcriptional regulator [Enterobacter asburiae]|nr:LacI family DNA-binding transcriptional regulator [Enterobacter asburiae]